MPFNTKPNIGRSSPAGGGTRAASRKRNGPWPTPSPVSSAFRYKAPRRRERTLADLDGIVHRVLQGEYRGLKLIGAVARCGTILPFPRYPKKPTVVTCLVCLTHT
jgi:hypothetical protein